MRQKEKCMSELKKDKTIDRLALDFKSLIVDNYIKENLKFFKSLPHKMLVRGYHVR